MQTENVQPENSGNQINGVDRASLIAEMESLSPDTQFDFTDMDNSEGGAKAAEEKPKEPAAPSEDETPTEESPPPKTEDEDEEAPEKDEDEESDEDEGDDEAEEPEQTAADDDDVDAEALSSIQRHRRRALEELDTKRREALAEVEARERAVREREKGLAPVEDFEKEIRRLAQLDPIALLQKYGGHNEDTFEDISKMSWFASKRGKADPASREAAAKSLRERALQQQVEEQGKLLREFMERDQNREQERTQQQQAKEYLDRIVRAVPSDATRLAGLLKEDREEAVELLRTTALDLMEELDEKPTPSRVAKRAEKNLRKIHRAQLKKMGLDPDTVLGSNTKSTNPVAGKSVAAKTLSTDLGTTTTPRSTPKSREEEIAEVARALESGNLGDGF